MAVSSGCVLFEKVSVLVCRFFFSDFFNAARQLSHIETAPNVGMKEPSLYTY